MTRTLVGSLDFTKKLKNYIINGGFDFWQRGTTSNFNATAFNGYNDVDRFGVIFDGSSTKDFTISKSTDTPNDSIAQSAEFLVDTTIASPSGDELALVFRHRVEGNIISEIQNKNMKLSFWFKSNLVQEFKMYAFNSKENKVKTLSFSNTQADTWEKINISTDWDSSGHFTDNNTGYEFAFVALANGNFTGHVEDGNFNTRTAGVSIVANPVNIFQAGNYFRVAGMMLTEDTGFELEFQRAGRNYQEELELCQRYFERQEYSGQGQIICAGWVQNSDTIQGIIEYTFKRAVPNITTTLANGNGLVFRSKNADLSINNASISFISRHPEKSLMNVPASNTIGNGSAGHFRANTATTGLVDIDAEL